MLNIWFVLKTFYYYIFNIKLDLNTVILINFKNKYLITLYIILILFNYPFI